MQTFIKLLKLVGVYLFVAAGHGCASEIAMNCQADEYGGIDFDSECWSNHISQLQEMETIAVDNRYETHVSKHSTPKYKLVDFYKIKSKVEQRKVFNEVLDKLNNDLCEFNDSISISPDVCFQLLRVGCFEIICGLWIIYKDGKLVSHVRLKRMKYDGLMRLYISTVDDKKNKVLIHHKLLRRILEPFDSMINSLVVIKKRKKIDYIEKYFMAIRDVSTDDSFANKKLFNKRYKLKTFVSFFEYHRLYGRLLYESDDCKNNIQLCESFHTMTDNDLGTPSLLKDIYFRGVEFEASDTLDETVRAHFEKVGMFPSKKAPNVYIWNGMPE